MKEQCSNCKYYVIVTKDGGECHRFTRQVVLIPKPTLSIGTHNSSLAFVPVGVWSPVRIGDWCGEYKSM